MLFTRPTNIILVVKEILVNKQVNYFARINLLMDRLMKSISLSASDRCPVIYSLWVC